MRICYLLISLLIIPLAWSQERAARPAKEFVARQALVIGNADYAYAGRLRNPVNDAKAIGSTLKELGFEVRVITDANRRKMETAIRQFGKDLRGQSSAGLFYFAGHGMQIEGENYLLPTDINPSNEFDVTYDAVPVGKLLGQMEVAGNGMNVVILDACRNNPFARSFRSSSRGLAQVVAPTGSFISYATAPGQVAADGEGSNGLFTEKLLKHITTPGLTLERVFKQVRVDVQQASNSRQVPWDSSSVTGDFFFVPPVAAPPAVTLLELDDLQAEAEAAELERLKEQQRLQQVSRERQRIKTQWQAWQQRMEKDYDKVAAFEQQSIGNLLKIESWERFLGNWKDNNPYSEQDKELRSKAQTRIIYWQKEIQEQKRDHQVVKQQKNKVEIVLRGEEALKQLRADESCENCDLQNADLQNAKLYNAKLNGADLRSANLSGADLRSANLSGADLEKANLQNASLKNADIMNANLRNINLYKAFMYEANLGGANLTEANLKGANLTEANLKGANLTEANLTDVSFYRTKFCKTFMPNGEINNIDCEVFLKTESKDKHSLHKSDSNFENQTGKDPQKQYNLLLSNTLRGQIDAGPLFSGPLFYKRLSVLIELQIETDGAVNTYRIKQSSGSQQFDQVVMMGMKEIELPPLPDGLNNNPPYIVNIRINP